MHNQLLGNRYRILDRIGEGGMAYVYLALDEKLGRKVAIKVLHEHMEKNADIRKRFQLEAEAVSRLEHPNIVKIYDFSGNESPRLWIVTEVIRGKNLAQYAEKGPGRVLHPIVASCIVREILKALTRAHDLGIIHRDIKPENVMITVDGRVKLMDFGIAKDLGRSNVTQTGTFMGSPSYMAPEQIRGKDIDQRSDLYSLSVLFYEIVTGRLPFIGQTTHDVVMRIIEGSFTEPRFIMPTLADLLNEVIVKGMAKNQVDRHNSAREYGTVIDQYLGSVGFHESHIELERYFEDKKTFEERIDKTEILPPGKKSIALKLKESRLESLGRDTATPQKTSQRKPGPPFIGERRTVPRSLGARRFRSPREPSILVKEQGREDKAATNRDSTVHLNTGRSTSQSVTRGEPAPRNLPPQPRASTLSPPEKKASPPPPKLEESLQNIARGDRARPPKTLPVALLPPRPMRMLPIEVHSPLIPSTALPPQPIRRLPRPQRIHKRRSHDGGPRPFRIAVVRPSLLSTAMGVIIIGAILTVSAWGFWQLQVRLGKYAVDTADGQNETFEKDIAAESGTKSQSKVHRKKSPPSGSTPHKAAQAPPSPNAQTVASTTLKALRAERPWSPPAKTVKGERLPPSPQPVRLQPANLQEVGSQPRVQGGGGRTVASKDRHFGDGKSKPSPSGSTEGKIKEKKSTKLKTSSGAASEPQSTDSVALARTEKGDGVSYEESEANGKSAKQKSEGKTGIARFKVSSQPAAEIYIDGQRLGTTVDMTTSSGWLSVAPGVHSLELRRQGYETHKIPLDLKPGDDLGVRRIELRPSAADTPSSPAKVSLTILVNMLPAQVTLRRFAPDTTQAFTLKTQAKTLQLDTGRYQIKIEHNGEIKERELTLTGAQGDLTFSADFKGEE